MYFIVPKSSTENVTQAVLFVSSPLRVEEQSVNLSLPELVATIAGNEFDDGADIIRAPLEDDTLQNVASVTKDENSQQLVHERLSHIDTCEVDHNLTIAPQYFFSLKTYRRSSHAGS
jgi:hypothetical protein